MRTNNGVVRTNPPRRSDWAMTTYNRAEPRSPEWFERAAAQCRAAVCTTARLAQHSPARPFRLGDLSSHLPASEHYLMMAGRPRVSIPLPITESHGKVVTMTTTTAKTGSTAGEIYDTVGGAQYLHISVRTFRRLLAEGQVSYSRLPGSRKLLFRRADLDALLDQGRVDPGATSGSGRRCLAQAPDHRKWGNNGPLSCPFPEAESA